MDVRDFEIWKSEIIPDVVLFRTQKFSDLRGSLYTTFYKDVMENYLPDNLYFKHDKFAMTFHNCLRGIHGDTKSWKLVTSVFGEVYEVFVDLRPDSSTYKKWDKVLINQDNQISVLLPPGLGNSFYVTSEIAMYHYKLAYNGEYFDAKDQFSLKWNDPEIGIEWPSKSPMLSDRDK
ncbi:MAG: dTDP-4-dehydrorhamnose 3,5-epimerase family protein [Eubacteriales bacterium]|nr:dTDP-4-dehydrorhamnose 3,5-epimerase family protein [Eubacteriales bacterium]MDD4475991.1 dTDP-4-dehydrorhamnose 3,5-epimerase family protein [Eubacteriales bacterium]